MKSESKRYVVGFLFSEDEENVLLLRKKKPEWQAGKLNGMGGHVEEGEEFSNAMAREGIEESGLYLPWEHFAIIRGDDWVMHCYRCIGLDEKASTVNDVGEAFERVKVSDVTTACVSTIPNLRWLIPMALNSSSHDWIYEIREGVL